MREHRIGERTVTAVGAGDVRLATAAARNLDASAVSRAVHAALERGVTLLDVADEEDAERLCGDAVRSLRLRDRVVVACRVPLLAPRPGAPQRDVLPERLPPAHVQQRVEASLRATRLEVLALAQLPLRPAWLASTAWPELAGTCLRLVREGKVLCWGALADEELELSRAPWLAAVSVPFSLCERAAEPMLAAKLPILARRPLAGGALAGALGPGAVLALRDDRRALDDAALTKAAVIAARLAAWVERVPPAARSCDEARAIVDRNRRPEHLEARTVAELALRWVIDRGAIALPRLHRPEHLDEALAAARAAPLSAPLLQQLNTFSV